MSRNHKPKKKRRWLIYFAGAFLLWAGLVFVFDFFPEEEKALRRDFRNAVEKTFPKQAEEIAKSFGLTYYGQKFAASPTIDPRASYAVLIHGLDDPGKVWMNLAPMLTSKNFSVLQMRYPNDQPIVDSAKFFYDELKRSKQLGIRETVIVAHSMGGLVTREMLTNPQIGFVEGVRTGEVPRVTEFIMVGTPNHGSELARFRVLGELRDQWLSMLKGRGHILRGILDGAGEAKIDLLPKSQFLTTLNERPHPEDVNMLIIAGVVAPWEGEDIDRFVNSAREKVAAGQQNMLTDLQAFLESVSNGLGDGLVTVESTRLDGIDHRTVRGTHLSMIRNISEESSRIPPAVPLVIEHLGPMSAEKKH